MFNLYFISKYWKGINNSSYLNFYIFFNYNYINILYISFLHFQERRISEYRKNKEFLETEFDFCSNLFSRKQDYYRPNLDLSIREKESRRKVSTSTLIHEKCWKMLRANARDKITWAIERVCLQTFGGHCRYSRYLERACEKEGRYKLRRYLR